jgi:hypothetical protein
MDADISACLKSNIRMGAGYNPGYLLTDPQKKLSLPKSVTHIELGLSEFVRWINSNPVYPGNLSLHLARTAITEGKEEQDRFIQHLKSNLFNKDLFSEERLVSIGVHLIGSRSEGIGRYGFSSHYKPLATLEKRAIRFVNEIQDQLGLPVWIENANFYSHSVSDILDSWKSVERICRSTKACLIADLSHLFIDASNNGLNPSILLGAVPWDLVVELHLSGIIEGPDGAFHDGHSVEVHDQVWQLLDNCLNSLITTEQSVIVTIEHTDPCWIQCQQKHDSDFSRLIDIVKQRRIPCNRASSADEYAKSYLKKLLRQWIPKLAPACEQRQISFNNLVDNWIEEVTIKEGKRIAFTADEIPKEELSEVYIAAQSFVGFAKDKIRTCD